MLKLQQIYLRVLNTFVHATAMLWINILHNKIIFRVYSAKHRIVWVYMLKFVFEMEIVHVFESVLKGTTDA
jgi:hypothetical protein